MKEKKHVKQNELSTVEVLSDHRPMVRFRNCSPFSFTFLFPVFCIFALFSFIFLLFRSLQNPKEEQVFQDNSPEVANINSLGELTIAALPALSACVAQTFTGLIPLLGFAMQMQVNDNRRYLLSTNGMLVGGAFLLQNVGAVAAQSADTILLPFNESEIMQLLQAGHSDVLDLSKFRKRTWEKQAYWQNSIAPVYSLAVLPQGQLASSADAIIKIWDLKTQSCVASLKGHKEGTIWNYGSVRGRIEHQWHSVKLRL